MSYRSSFPYLLTSLDNLDTCSSASLHFSDRFWETLLVTYSLSCYLPLTSLLLFLLLALYLDSRTCASAETLVSCISRIKPIAYCHWAAALQACKAMRIGFQGGARLVFLACAGLLFPKTWKKENLLRLQRCAEARPLGFWSQVPCLNRSIDSLQVRSSKPSWLLNVLAFATQSITAH